MPFSRRYSILSIRCLTTNPCSFIDVVDNSFLSVALIPLATVGCNWTDYTPLYTPSVPMRAANKSKKNNVAGLEQEQMIELT
jgi:hypothetical protein